MLDFKPFHAICCSTHWGRVTHICVGKLTIIGSNNGLLPERRQVIIWTIVGILLIGPLGTNFGEMLIEIQTFLLKKICLKMLSAKCCPFRPRLNVLSRWATAWDNVWMGEICSLLRYVRSSSPTCYHWISSRALAGNRIFNAIKQQNVKRSKKKIQQCWKHTATTVILISCYHNTLSSCRSSSWVPLRSKVM